MRSEGPTLQVVPLTVIMPWPLVQSAMIKFSSLTRLLSVMSRMLSNTMISSSAKVAWLRMSSLVEVELLLPVTIR